MDLQAVRTFVAAADAGQFQLAADELSVTQQAVSKRVAALEKDLGVRLFTRTARGVRLTIDGQAFLPHARELLRAEERATASVRGGGRALRVDVISRRIAPTTLLRGFHRAHPGIELDVVTLFDAETAIAAVRSGTIDATFRALTMPARRLGDGIRATLVLDEPHQLLTGPAHELASASAVTPAQLAGHKIWIPGIVPGTEWAAYYDELATAFGLTIDAVGPNFGTETLLDALAESDTLASLVGEHTRLLWPADYGLRRIPVRDPKLVYPHSLIWRGDNPHPALSALRRFCGSVRPGRRGAAVWAPTWDTVPPPGRLAHQLPARTLRVSTSVRGRGFPGAFWDMRGINEGVIDRGTDRRRTAADRGDRHGRTGRPRRGRGPATGGQDQAGPRQVRRDVPQRGQRARSAARRAGSVASAEHTRGR